MRSRLLMAAVPPTAQPTTATATSPVSITRRTGSLYTPAATANGGTNSGESSVTDKGWGWPQASRKAHYFSADERISICGKWWYLGPLEETETGSPDDCALCTKKLVKLRATRD